MVHFLKTTTILFVCLFWVQMGAGQPCQNLNISEGPNLPSICSEITMTTLHDQLDRPYLYVAHKEAGLTVYHLSEPQSPVLIANVLASTFEGLHVMNLTQEGNYLYLAIGNHFGTGQQLSGMAIIDVSQPESPELSDYWILQDDEDGAGIVKVEGNLAYLGAMKHGLIILDVSNKTDIQFVSQYIPELNFPDPNPDASKINARGMEVQDGMVYLCYDAGGLRIIDATNPNLPVQVGQYSNPELNGLPRAYNNLVLHDDLVYVAIDYCGLEVLDISDPANINLVGWWNPWNCQSNPLNWFTSPGHTNELAFFPECKLLLVSSGKTDMLVLDVSDPAAPDSCNYFGEVDNGIGTWGVSAWKNQAYLTYICNPLPFPFPSNWTGVKILDLDGDCLISNTSHIANSELLIYPNPVADKLTVQLPELKKGELKFYNSLGQLLLTEKLEEGLVEWKIDLSKIESGIYFVAFHGETEMWSSQIVKL